MSGVALGERLENCNVQLSKFESMCKCISQVGKYIFQHSEVQTQWADWRLP